MPGTDYFGETALEQDIIFLSTPCGNHTLSLQWFRLTQLLKVPLRRNFTFLFPSFFKQNNVPPCTMSIRPERKKLKKTSFIKISSLEK